MIRQTSSHTSSFKDKRKDKQHLKLVDNSDDQPSKISGFSKIKEQDEGIIPYDIEHELELNIEKYSDDVKQQLRYLLLQLIKYPSVLKAFRHRCSNRMGYHDLKHIKNKLNGSSTYIHSTTYSDHCEDCGMLIQEKQIPTCSSIWEFPKVGLATFTLYKNIKLIMGFLFFLGTIFSIIELYVNIQITKQILTMNGQNFPIFFSNSTQVLNSSTDATLQFILSISGILLILVIIAWWISIFVVQCISRKYQRIVDQAYISAADFSIMLENMPLHYSEQKLRDEISRYYDSLVFNHNIKNTWGQVLKPFTIKKICRIVPFALTQSDVLDKELQGLDQDIYQKKKLFASWIEQMIENSRFTYTKPERERQYFNFQKMVQRRSNKVKEIQLLAKQQYQKAPEKVNTTIIVSFEYSQSADIIEHLNPQTVPAKIRYILSFCKSTQYFDIRDYMTNKESGIVVSRAPEPEDIVWGNVEIPLCMNILRKILTWSLMILISGGLFGIIWGLSSVQAGGTGIWASILIAFMVTLTNMFSKFVLRKISPYEKDFTQTDRQRGILLKGLFVMAVNWIIPIVITNVANENKNFYALSGQSYEIFFMGIFQSFIPPIIRIFDPEHIFLKIYSYCKSKPRYRMGLKQSELNNLIQFSEYELGWNYLYFINLLYFCCFYVNLQPIIVAFALFGCIFMFWAEKYVLLNRSQRPQKMAKALTYTVQSLLSMAPIVLWIGHIVWVNTMISDFSSFVFTADMILMSVSLLYFITPWKALSMCAFHYPEEELLFYDSCRVHFPVQYDRINPATVDYANSEYNQYLQDKRGGDNNKQILDNSNGNLAENFDTRYVVEQISKIPSIFGRKNNLSRKVDRQDGIKPKNLKGDDDIQLHIIPHTHSKDPLSPQHKERNIIESRSHKVKINNRSESGSPHLKNPPNYNHTQQNLMVQKNIEDDVMSQAQTEKIVTLNMSSNGNAFVRRRPQQKRKSVSVHDNHQDYQYNKTKQQKK